MVSRQLAVLERDLDGIWAFLSEFDLPSNGEERIVEINPTGDLVTVRNFPLPDEFSPDYVDVLLMTHRYPDAPPIGIYVLERNNARVISQLRAKFNVFTSAAYDAPTVPGYRWICYIYKDNRWLLNHRKLAIGDNLRKFLIGFFHQCSMENPHGH